MRKLFESAGGVKARGQFVGERLIVNKAVCAGRADGLLVKAHRVDIAAVDASNLRAHQGGAVVKIVRTVRRPDLELSVVGDQSLDMLPSLAGRCGLAICRLGECTVEVILCRLEL